MKKNVNIVEPVLELILLATIVNLIRFCLDLIAWVRFGVEMGGPESMWLQEISKVTVIYFGIAIMLYISASPKSKYASFAFEIIAITEFIKSSDIFFLKILPQITWAKTGDFFIFLCGLGMLSLFPLIVDFHKKMTTKLSTWEGSEETEGVQEEDQKEEV